MGVPRAEPERRWLGSDLIDAHGRRVEYLRLAVTDRCNLRCRYCLPAEGIPLLPGADLLKGEELIRIGRAAVSLGIGKIRLTGGEPTCRGDIIEVVSGLAGLPGLDKLAMTTNGQLLKDLAAPLRRAGMGSVNISVDSLRPERFAAITRGGELARCLAGLDSALSAALEVKLNVVVMRGVNDDEIADFADLAVRRHMTVRFIEYMPTGCRPAGSDLFIPAREFLAAVADKHNLTEVPPPPGAGPSRDFLLAGAQARVGVIAARSQCFCAECNRIRVTAAGRARGCLFDDRGEDLRPHLGAEQEEPLAEALARVIRSKPRGHRLHQGAGRPNSVFMSRMGG